MISDDVVRVINEEVILSIVCMIELVIYLVQLVNVLFHSSTDNLTESNDVQILRIKALIPFM
jgi:hypothetical protein